MLEAKASRVFGGRWVYHLPDMPLRQRDRQHFGGVSGRCLGLTIGVPSCLLLVKTSNGTDYDNLRRLVQVFLLIALVQQLQESHRRVPDSRRVDSKCLRELGGVNVEVLVGKLLQRHVRRYFCHLWARDAGVADQQVQISSIILDVLDCRLQAVLGRDIALYDGRIWSDAGSSLS